MAYGKIFVQIYDSSVAEDPPPEAGVLGYQVAYVFQAMVVLSNRDGILDMRPRALAARINMPQDLVEKSIAVLEAPDPESRSETHEGRRIVRLDDHRSWGWRVVAKAAYRDVRDPDAEREQSRSRMARKRERDRCTCGVGEAGSDGFHGEGCDAVTVGYARIRHADENTDTNTEKKTTRPKPSAKASGPALAEFPCVGTGAKTWSLYREKLDQWVEAFPGVDVRSELKNARQWLLDNPTRQKTHRGMTRYLGAWLSRSQNSGRQKPRRQTGVRIDVSKRKYQVNRATETSE